MLSILKLPVSYMLVQNGETALHVASREGFSDIVALLLQAGADTSLKNDVSAVFVSALFESQFFLSSLCLFHRTDPQHISLVGLPIIPLL